MLRLILTSAAYVVTTLLCAPCALAQTSPVEHLAGIWGANDVAGACKSTDGAGLLGIGPTVYEELGVTVAPGEIIFPEGTCKIARSSSLGKFEIEFEANCFVNGSQISGSGSLTNRGSLEVTLPGLASPRFYMNCSASADLDTAFESAFGASPKFSPVQSDDMDGQIYYYLSLYGVVSQCATYSVAFSKAEAERLTQIIKGLFDAKGASRAQRDEYWRNLQVGIQSAQLTEQNCHDTRTGLMMGQQGSEFLIDKTPPNPF